MQSSTRSKRIDKDAEYFFEKCPTVLWALTPNGILLHNFKTGQFVELKGDDYVTWCYLDGTHSLDAIVGILERRTDNRMQSLLRIRAKKLLNRLVTSGFVVVRDIQ